MRREQQQANEELMQRLTDTIEHAKGLGLSDEEVRLLCYGTGIPRRWFEQDNDEQKELDF